VTEITLFFDEVLGVRVLPIEFRVCKEDSLLAQYYDLRERCFRDELGLAGFDGSEEERDRQGAILVAVENGRCVAGVRISPMVTLLSQVQQLGLSRESCCMWERFVFDPAARTISLIREFIAFLIETSRHFGYEHAMVLSSHKNARFYRRCHTALGVGYQIHRPVPHCAEGKFAGLEHYLSVSYLARGVTRPLAADSRDARKA
jgi:hypothetical protein